eukprot:15333414-Ditylum_brightwellii.AAC.1
MDCSLDERMKEYSETKSRRKKMIRNYNARPEKKQKTGYAYKYIELSLMICRFHSTDCGLDINMIADNLEKRHNENKLKQKGECVCRTKGCCKEGHFDSRSFLYPFNKVNIHNTKVADGISVQKKQREPTKGPKAECTQKRIDNSASHAKPIRKKRNDTASDAKPPAKNKQ